ncbi:glycerol-3-phosphate responsive antiterminator [Oceanobacillus timonensis]|uniref:glycerol-3-phosphate responsive antiterminator n=1 Tax=Oceanobacillus timonensis TaxID=1926285 RepID=UPI0009BBE7FA|nr:glycerol-3-phosphate responsive antiterminator [Oceanobacillus timonensis]
MIKSESEFHIIPSIVDLKQLSLALKLDLEYILLSDTHIGNLKSLVEICHQSNKKVIVNIDLVGGLNPDNVGIKLLKQQFKVDVVIGRGTSKINLAKSVGLTTVQHIILEDSLSLKSSLKFIEDSKTDMVELRPAYYGIKYIDKFKEIRDVPYILSGFLDSKEMIEQAKESGFYGATTSASELWNI